MFSDSALILRVKITSPFKRSSFSATSQTPLMQRKIRKPSRLWKSHSFGNDSLFAGSTYKSVARKLELPAAPRKVLTMEVNIRSTGDYRSFSIAQPWCLNGYRGELLSCRNEAIWASIFPTLVDACVGLRLLPDLYAALH